MLQVTDDGVFCLREVSADAGFVLLEESARLFFIDGFGLYLSFQQRIGCYLSLLRFLQSFGYAIVWIRRPDGAVEGRENYLAVHRDQLAVKA